VPFWRPGQRQECNAAAQGAENHETEFRYVVEHGNALAEVNGQVIRRRAALVIVVLWKYISTENGGRTGIE
jgi:hypothetical protein